MSPRRELLDALQDHWACKPGEHLFLQWMNTRSCDTYLLFCSLRELRFPCGAARQIRFFFFMAIEKTYEFGLWHLLSHGHGHVSYIVLMLTMTGGREHQRRPPSLRL